MRAAVWLDRIALGALCLALAVMLFGGIRMIVGGLRLSMMRPWALLAVVGAVVLLRLRVAPEPVLWERIASGAGRVVQQARSRDSRAIATVWIATRLGVLLVAFGAVATIGVPPDFRGAAVSSNALLNLTYRWDTGWYLAIAAEGYRWDGSAGPERQQSIAFFPAYPLLMRVGGAILGARTTKPLRPRAMFERLWTRTMVAGWLLALAASFAALRELFAWASAMVGRRTALASVALLSAYPFAVYFSAAYTESLFLLSVLAAFNGMRTGRGGRVAAWGLLSGLVRPNGFLITLPLLVLAWQRPFNWRLWIAALMPCLGMLMFAAYVWSLTGHPFAWIDAHAAWGRTRPTWEASVTEPFEQLAHDGVVNYAMSAPYQLFNGAAVVFALVLLPAVWRHLGTAPTVLVVAMILPPLAAGGLMSMGRITSTVFPLSVALAHVVPRRHLSVWLVAFAMAQGLAAVLFFTWRPLV